MSGKIISFFNHKGGVGKTTLVHNLGVILSDFGYKVLLIDADPQMNLTSAMYGLSNGIDYSYNENSKWNEYITKYISFQEYLNIHLKDEKCDKNFFNWSNPQETVPLFENKKGILDMISGSINLSNIEADLFGIVKNRNDFTENIPYKFEKSIRQQTANYDFILIDTSPSASSIINALLVMGSDYFIAPVSPSFFSLQAINNLSYIFKNWTDLLGTYQTTHGNKGLSFNPKFLGLVVQMAKRFNGGAIKESDTKFSKSAQKWINDVNISVKDFQKFALDRGKAITDSEFKAYFDNSDPFIIATCCDFTAQLRSIAEKAGIPVIKLTQDICDKFKDSGSNVGITKEDSQYTISFNSIKKSYTAIAQGLTKI